MTNLTPREKQILHCLCEGMTNVAIATKLKIQEDTVKAHLQHMGKKMGVKSRLGMALIALKTPSSYANLVLKLEAINQRMERDIARSRLLIQQLLSKGEV